MARNKTPRREIRVEAELQHVEDLHPDGSIDDAAAIWTHQDPHQAARNVYIRITTGDEMLVKWLKERPGLWTIIIEPPEAA